MSTIRKYAGGIVSAAAGLLFAAALFVAAVVGGKQWLEAARYKRRRAGALRRVAEQRRANENAREERESALRADLVDTVEEVSADVRDHAADVARRVGDYCRWADGDREATRPDGIKPRKPPGVT